MCSTVGGSGASRSGPPAVVKENSCPSILTFTVLLAASSRAGVHTMTLPAGEPRVVRDAGRAPSRSMIEMVAESRLVQIRVLVGAAEPANGRNGIPASAHSQAFASPVAAKNAAAANAITCRDTTPSKLAHIAPCWGKPEGVASAQRRSPHNNAGGPAQDPGARLEGRLWWGPYNHNP